MLNDSEKTKAQLIEELVSLRSRAAHPELKRDLQHSYLPVKSDDETVVGISCVVQDLTDSKRAHESLRLTQFALDHAADPVYWVRHDGRIFYANHAACESLGYSRDELLSMSVSEIDPDFPAEAWPAHWQALKQSGRSTFEAHHQTKRGRVFPVEITTNYLTDGPHEFMWAYVHDITERKRAVEALRESQARLLKAQHVAGMGFLDWNLKTDDIYWSDEVYRLYGVDPKEISPTIDLTARMVHPDDRDFVQERLKLAIQGAEPYDMDHRIVRIDGQVIWVHAQAEIARDAEGNAGTLLGTIVDITDRKRSEQRLRFVVDGTASSTGEEFYGALVENLAGALNVQFAFVSEVVDAEAMRLRLLANWTGTEFGPTFEYDTTDKPCEHVVGKGLARFAQGVQELFPKDVWLKENGIESYLAIPLFDTAGHSIGHLGVAHQAPMEDVSLAEPVLRTFASRASGEIMRRRDEKLLRQRESELAHAGRLSLMGEMVAGLVHEVGQPLYSIGNFSKACENHIEQNGPVETEKLSHWIAEISACVRRSKGILSRLRGFARRSVPHPKALSIDQAIDESIKMLDFELRDHNVAVDYDRAEGIEVRADEVQVQQVLANLIRNACESFNASGSEDARLTIRTKSRDGFCDVSVEDNGPGMNEEQIERAFQSFFTSKASGLGLGLAISKTIVEGHGGKIAIVPNRHRGITCHFTLPLARGGA